MSTVAATSARSADGGFLRSRLGSALAIAPLGVWTVVHLWNNLAAFKGASEWEHAVTEYDHPVAFFFSTLFALLPVGLHTVWSRNALRRLETVVILVFIVLLAMGWGSVYALYSAGS